MGIDQLATDLKSLGGAKAPLIVIASSKTEKQDFAGQANHYTLLATIEKKLGLPCLATPAT